jgi:outer membrane protein OmpA-like peptidoglycan-associated protein
VSYGKEVPLCTDSNEECWTRNRRDHFAVTGKVKQ